MEGDPAQDPRISIEPLVDVAFLMLIFFLVSTTILKQETDLGVKMLSEGLPTAAPPVATVVEVREGGSVVVNPGPHELVVSENPNQRELPRLERHLRMLMAAGGEPPVMLRADEDAVYQRVTDVIDCMKKVGITRVAFVDEGA